MNPIGRKLVSFGVGCEAEEQEDNAHPVDAAGEPVEIASTCTMWMTISEDEAVALAYELLGKALKRDTVQVKIEGLLEVRPWRKRRPG